MTHEEDIRRVFTGAHPWPSNQPPREEPEEPDAFIRKGRGLMLALTACALFWVFLFTALIEATP